MTEFEQQLFKGMQSKCIRLELEIIKLHSALDGLQRLFEAGIIGYAVPIMQTASQLQIREYFKIDHENTNNSPRSACPNIPGLRCFCDAFLGRSQSGWNGPILPGAALNWDQLD